MLNFPQCPGAREGGGRGGSIDIFKRCQRFIKRSERQNTRGVCIIQTNRLHVQFAVMIAHWLIVVKFFTPSEGLYSENNSVRAGSRSHWLAIRSPTLAWFTDGFARATNDENPHGANPAA